MSENHAPEPIHRQAGHHQTPTLRRSGSRTLFPVFRLRRGDYATALAWYRQYLAIEEQLGSRAGMASTFSQIGILYTTIGRAADAVLLNLFSLFLRLEILSPVAQVDPRMLSRQRQMLGLDTFGTIVSEHCSAESLVKIIAAIDEWELNEPKQIIL